MLWSSLSKTIATVLVLVSCSAVFSIVLGQTILSSHYLESQLAATDAYNRLSVAISTQIAQDSGQTDPQLTAKLQQIVTPTILQQKINTTLDQLQSYLTGTGQAPVIDVSDLVGQAQAAGLPIPANSGLDKPIVLWHGTQTEGLGTRFANVKLGTIVLGLILVVLLLAVSWKRHKFVALPDAAIAAGVLLGILAAILRLAPGVADKYIKFDFGSNAFAGVAHDLVERIILDLGMRFAIIATVVFVCGLACRILVGWLARPRAPQPIRPVVAPKPQTLA